MRTKLIPIGNSKGIRIPKAVIQQYDLDGEIELDLRDGAVVIKPVRSARRGWDKAFAKMRRQGDDKLLLPELDKPTDWDQKEWKW